MYYEPSTGKTYCNIELFKVEYSHTSFGQLQTEEELNSIGLFTLIDDRPFFDPQLEKIVLTGIVENNGTYKNNYVVVQADLTEVQKLNILIGRFDSALTAHLDATAQQRKYDNRITCMVRAGFPGPFQAEGIAFATWCDTCNQFAYTFMSEVLNGTQPMPNTQAEFIALLPEMIWPT